MTGSRPYTQANARCQAFSYCYCSRWRLARRKNRPVPKWHSLFGEWKPGRFEHSHAMRAIFTNNVFEWQADVNTKRVVMNAFVRDIVDRLRWVDTFFVVFLFYNLSTVLNTLNVKYFRIYTLLLLLSSRPGIRLHTKQPAPKYARASNKPPPPKKKKKKKNVHKTFCH